MDFEFSFFVFFCIFPYDGKCTEKAVQRSETLYFGISFLAVFIPGIFKIFFECLRDVYLRLLSTIEYVKNGSFHPFDCCYLKAL